MTILLAASGTRGDVQPFVALGLGLQSAGHTVQIICPKNEQAFVEQYGLSCRPLSIDIQAAMNTEAVQKMTESVLSKPSVRTIALISQTYRPKT